MGMSLSAYTCVGAIIQSQDFKENNKILSEEELDDKYEGYISEYFYTILESLGVTVGTTGYSAGYGDEEIIATLDNTVSEAYYGATEVDMSVLTKKNVQILKDKLDEAGIKYESVGIFVYPTYG